MICESSFLSEFIDRGFFFQCTDKKALDIKLKNKIVAYIGFDCTAKSLHVGSLIQIMILRLLQKHGHQILILLGDGTTKIGDPSGKDEARKILSKEDIFQNLEGIKNCLEKFININGDNPAVFINNDKWLRCLNYIDFLREVGSHFSINRMISFDSVKSRLEREQPLSFLEFNYMILQAYDFFYLWKNNNCSLQIGGSDQWGNIVNGVELIRRISFVDKNTNQTIKNSTTDINKNDDIVFGLTSPLITTSDGKKMGKTAYGAVWLDSDLTSPYDYFQYFRNISDSDIAKFLKLFTELELKEIEELTKHQGKELNQAKEVLAYEATKICHGKEEADNAFQKSRELFINRNFDAIEEKIINLGKYSAKKLVDIIFEANAVISKAEAKRLIEGKAVKIDGKLINDINYNISNVGIFELSLGKKKFLKIKLVKD